MTRQDRGSWLAWGLMASGVLALTAAVAAVLDQNRVDDDAYMFVRYARNFAAHGRVAWDPGGTPVYGLTSLAYFAIVFLVHIATHADPAVVLVASTLCAGAAFVGLAAWMGARAVDGVSPAVRVWSAAAAVAGLGLGANALAPHFVSGMDTLCTLAAVTAVLGVALGACASRDARAAAAWGAAGGALLWVRPDTLVFGLGLPAAVALLGTVPERRVALRAAVVASLTAVALALVAWATLGSPLPLAVYAKVLRGYGADMREVYAGFAARELMAFFRAYAALVLPALIGLGLRVRRHGARAAGFDVGLGITVAVFLVFHCFFVLPIMGDRQRFDLPALPALLLLAVRGLHEMAAIPARAGARGTRVCIGIAGTALAALLVIAAREALQGARAPRTMGFGVLAHYRNGWPARMWLRLDRVAALPDDIVIATTEVGHPGILNPGKRIVDLAGLNDLEFARHGFSPDRLFARGAPDLFYITSRHYAGIRTALLQDARFATGYELVAVPGGLAVALRRDGRHYRELREALAAP